MLFRDRSDAGHRLAAALTDLKGSDCVVLALPRGGVPVAAQVAKALDAPLDLVLVRKIGAPRQPEFAIGSVVDGGMPIIICDNELMRLTDTSAKTFDEICGRELAEIERRRALYMGGRRPEPLEGRTAIVIDDGLATGNTMTAALRSVRLRRPKTLVMAIPVSPRGAVETFRGEADRVVCLATPEPFGSVGHFYRDFDQTSDEEVTKLLTENRDSIPKAAAFRTSIPASEGRMT